MLVDNYLDPSDLYYNPNGDSVQGCLETLFNALSELESDVTHIGQHPDDKAAKETMLLRVLQMKEVLKHTLYREFFS